MMFNYFDGRLFDQFNTEAGAVLGRLVDFQRAGLEAVREMADNNNQAILQLTSLRSPQDFLAAQQEVAEKNLAVLSRLVQQATGGKAAERAKH